MRRILIAVGSGLATVLVVASLAFAGPPPGSNACPPSSPAGGGSPSCGKPHKTKPPAETCTLGPITGSVDAALKVKLVHDLLCALAANGITI